MIRCRHSVLSKLDDAKNDSSAILDRVGVQVRNESRVFSRNTRVRARAE